MYNDRVILKGNILTVPHWLKSLGQFFVTNRRFMTNFGRQEQYTIDSMAYVIGNEAKWAIGHRSTSFPGAEA